MATYNVGFDFGNSDTNAVMYGSGGAMISVRLPSATALGSLAQLADLRSASGGDDVDMFHALRDGEYVLAMAGAEWFVGDLALHQARNATTARGDIRRYASDRALHLLLVASSALMKQPEYTIQMVTGLPVETYGDVDIRRQVKARLSGDHPFSMNGREYTAHVRCLKVIMEGAGALVAYGLPGNHLQATIDIGGRTTDLFVADGQSPIVPLCRGKAVGVENVGDLVSQRFAARYGRPMKASELHDVLVSYAGHSVCPSIYHNGAKVEASLLFGWVGEAIANVGSEIASFVAQTWASSERGGVASDIARVVLVGGGAYYFQEQLRRRIPHLIVPDRPELANAMGYAALASALSSASFTRVV